MGKVGLSPVVRLVHVQRVTALLLPATTADVDHVAVDKSAPETIPHLQWQVRQSRGGTGSSIRAPDLDGRAKRSNQKDIYNTYTIYGIGEADRFPKWVVSSNLI